MRFREAVAFAYAMDWPLNIGITTTWTALGRVDKRDSRGPLNVIQAGVCDGDQLGTRPDVGRGMGVS